ncbi:MAG: glycosyltransferase family 2 protein [Candidatus Aenigmarchaeota archaeon]|nr:glycosyltransferase family 2 protein [Candidatus Aenigmarchaeota archaeon]
MVRKDVRSKQKRNNDALPVEYGDVMYKYPISIVTCAYNEEKTIGGLISRIRKALHDVKHEIIVVDDASTDKTHDIAKKCADRVIRTAHVGQTNCLWKGIREAKYPTVVTMDADLEHLPEDIPRLLAKLGTHDYVCGSRTSLPRLSERLSGVLLGRLLGVRDTFTNLRAFNGNVKRYFISKGHLTANTYGLEFQIRAKKGGFRVAEIPIKAIRRKDSRIGNSFRTELKLLRAMVAGIFLLLNPLA